MQSHSNLCFFCSVMNLLAQCFLSSQHCKFFLSFVPCFQLPITYNKHGSLRSLWACNVVRLQKNLVFKDEQNSLTKWVKQYAYLVSVFTSFLTFFLTCFFYLNFLILGLSLFLLHLFFLNTICSHLVHSSSQSFFFFIVLETSHFFSFAHFLLNHLPLPFNHTLFSSFFISEKQG